MTTGVLIRETKRESRAEGREGIAHKILKIRHSYTPPIQIITIEFIIEFTGCMHTTYRSVITDRAINPGGGEQIPPRLSGSGDLPSCRP